MPNVEDYFPALKYGATLVTDDIAPATVTAAKLTTNNNYMTLVRQTVGNGSQNLWVSGLTPVNGTVIGFFAANIGAAAGTISLYGSTAGTIAAIQFVGGTALVQGFMIGTGVLNAAIVSGEALNVNSTENIGTFCGYIVFKTNS